MALFKHPLAFASAARLRSKQLIIIFICIALLIELRLAPAFAYDNSIAPPFKVDLKGRGYNGVSIHPDGERWLISECTDEIELTRVGCYLFLYHRKIESYQRYDLDTNFSYTDAKFSPDGDLIVGVRRKILRDASHEEKSQLYAESEIFVMRTDESDFRILPIQKGRIKSPVMSADKEKILYWRAGTLRPANSKTTLMDFDVHEFDLREGKDALFAGPYQFFQARAVQYLRPNEIIVDAWGARKIGPDVGAYREKYGSSDIYFVQRGSVEFPSQAYPKIAFSKYPSLTKDSRIYLLGEVRPFGISLIETDFGHIKRLWRVPILGTGGIADITVSPDGSYLIFIYNNTSAIPPRPQNNLGMFDIKNESWSPVALPIPSSATLFSIKN